MPNKSGMVAHDLMVQQIIYYYFRVQGSYDMSAGYLDTTFAFSFGITGYFMLSTYKVYEKKGDQRQLVFCRETKMSIFTIKNRNQSSQKPSGNKNKDWPKSTVNGIGHCLFQSQDCLFLNGNSDRTNEIKVQSKPQKCLFIEGPPPFLDHLWEIR